MVQREGLRPSALAVSKLCSCSEYMAADMLLSLCYPTDLCSHISADILLIPATYLMIFCAYCADILSNAQLPEGSDKTARVVLMRYNRWNDDELHPYWGGIVHPFKKKANGEWDQDHCEDMDHLK